MFQKLTLSKEFSNLIQVLNLPDKILSEYVSPDMNLSKENKKLVTEWSVLEEGVQKRPTMTQKCHLDWF